MRHDQNGTNELHIGGVMTADAGQWRKWLRHSPAERLESASRLWLQSRDISKQTNGSQSRRAWIDIALIYAISSIRLLWDRGKK